MEVYPGWLTEDGFELYCKEDGVNWYSLYELEYKFAPCWFD